MKSVIKESCLDEDWRRKMELKNQYIALSRQEIIYKDTMDTSVVDNILYK